jgi:hypothetical protein
MNSTSIYRSIIITTLENYNINTWGITEKIFFPESCFYYFAHKHESTRGRLLNDFYTNTKNVRFLK